MTRPSSALSWYPPKPQPKHNGFRYSLYQRRGGLRLISTHKTWSWSLVSWIGFRQSMECAGLTCGPCCAPRRPRSSSSSITCPRPQVTCAASLPNHCEPICGTEAAYAPTSLARHALDERPLRTRRLLLHVCRRQGRYRLRPRCCTAWVPPPPPHNPLNPSTNLHPGCVVLHVTHHVKRGPDMHGARAWQEPSALRRRGHVQRVPRHSGRRFPHRFSPRSNARPRARSTPCTGVVGNRI